MRFRPYADINNVVRLREGRLEVGLSDLLEAAPASVLEAIAYILLCKLYRKPIPKRYQARYRQFLNRRHVREKVHAIRRVRGRKWIGAPGGDSFHLEEIFEELNQKFFGGMLGRPRLSWSRSASRTLLGHWDAAHNAIIVSRIFDRPGNAAPAGRIHPLPRDAAPQVSGRAPPRAPLRPLRRLPRRRKALPPLRRGQAPH